METKKTLGTKIISLVLTLLIVLSLIPMSVFSTFAADCSHAEYVNGFCTDCDSYEPATDENNDGIFEIANAGQLYWFAEYANSTDINSSAILTADIVVNEGVMTSSTENARGWTYIGYSLKHQYGGTFDGCGHTISGLYVNVRSDYAWGMFGYAKDNAVIKNLGVINSYFSNIMSFGKPIISSIVGMGNCTLINCYSNSTVYGSHYAIGIKGGTVINCYFTGTATTSGSADCSYSISGNTITNSYYLDTSADSSRGGQAMTQEQFESGEVAYLLGEAFGQTIGEQDYPVLGGDRVYLVEDYCKNETIYSNTNKNIDHKYVNGVCADCGVFEPAFYNGETDCYEIANAGQLYWFADYVNKGNTSANAILTENIVVNKNILNDDATLNESDSYREWTPIGNSGNKYTGAFDGNNKTISGLYFDDEWTVYAGLFGCVGKGGTVKNTGVKDSYFKAQNFVGGIAGYFYNCEITNCYNTGTLIGYDRVGGIAGYAEDCEITNCYNTGEINGEDFACGIVGEANCCKITNCYNTGTVTGSYDVSGIASSYEDCEITNCYNTGTVTGYYCVGGITSTAIDCEITNCYNVGVVTAEQEVGGVIGYNYESTVTNCYYLNTTCSGGIGSEDIVGSAEAKTAEQFASGEVAYLLGDAFGQNIGTDELPVLDGAKVYYGYESCASTEKSYSNRALYDVIPEHNHTLGDIDLDGRVTIRDVSTLSKYLVDIVELTDCQFSTADTNGDGQIDINDVTYIQKMIAELI